MLTPSLPAAHLTPGTCDTAALYANLSRPHVRHSECGKCPLERRKKKEGEKAREKETGTTTFFRSGLRLQTVSSVGAEVRGKLKFGSRKPQESVKRKHATQAELNRTPAGRASSWQG